MSTTRRRVRLTGLLLALGCATTALGAQTAPAPGNDFHVGDRVVMRVDVEPQLTDTFTVAAGPLLVLPIIGTVPLAGVRHAQIEKVLSDAVAKFYRNPVVHARALVRVAVLGEVLHPGFYAVPTEMLVPDVVMTAGGPTTTAGVNAISVVRDGKQLMRGDSIKAAMAHGLTLTQLGIQSEDQFVVPAAHDSEKTLRVIAELLAIPIAIVTVLILSRR